MTALLCGQDQAHGLKCELAHDVLRSSGRLRLRVNGLSMLPSVRPGDTLLVEKAKTEAVREGDIVLFGRDRRLFAHRVVQRLGSSRIQTQGDAMKVPDPLLDEHELMGKICWIVRDGRLIAPRSNPRFLARAVAKVVRKSRIAARAAARVYVRNQIS